MEDRCYSKADSLRADYVRAIGKRMGELSLKPQVARRLGIYVTADELWQVREGFPRWGLEKLLRFGERIGVGAMLVPVAGPAPTVPPPEPRVRRPATARARA